MSGPKVVTIVTREELVSLCDDLITSLEAAVNQWTRIGNRNEVLSASDIALATSRVESMRVLLARDGFLEIQKQVPAEIQFLNSDMDERLRRSVEAAAEQRKSIRRLARSAESVAKALSAQGIPIEGALQAPQKATREELEKSISSALTKLSRAASGNETSQRQRDLAASLGQEEERSTFLAWLTAQPPAPADPQIIAIETHLDELAALQPEAAAPFLQRLASLEAEPSDGRRRLLADSLALDIARAKTEAKAYQQSRQALETIKATLERAVSTSVAGVLASIDAALSGEREMEMTLQSARAFLVEIRKAEADAHRRNAFLSGLADLGYEVREGMETAWVVDGRVVLRSAKNPQYGVELGGNPEKLVQVRTVAIDGSDVPRSKTGDIAAETEFCGDFNSLRERLAHSGGAVTVVKALGIGTTDLKVVAVSSDEPVHADAKNPSARLLPR
jgi:hypothetical protein